MDEIIIGGPEYSITAKLTPRHAAGVNELVLNRFDAADEYGLPEIVNGQKKCETLIPTPKAGGAVVCDLPLRPTR